MKTRFLKYSFVLGMILIIASSLIILLDYLSLEPEDTSFAWSPDSLQLAFTCRRRQRDREWGFMQEYLGPHSGRDSLDWYELCILDINSRKRVRLTQNDQYDGNPTWLPDGDSIAYMSSATNQYLDIRLLALDSSTSTTLIVGDEQISPPIWSPVGHQVAFVSTRNNNPTGDLYLFDMDTGDTKRLTHMHGVNKFAWSFDGRYIVFAGGDYMKMEIFIVSVETTSVLQLTFDGGYKTSPVFSPDNSLVAFTAGERLAQVYIIDTLTRKTIQFSTNTTSVHQFPTWSPDGDSLAYIRTSYESERGTFLEIKGIDQDAERCSYEITTCPVLDLKWSPDGKYLALNQCADWNRDGWSEFKIWLFDVEQGVLEPLYTTFPWRVAAQPLPNTTNP